VWTMLYCPLSMLSANYPSVSELGYENLDYDQIVFPRLGFEFHINPTAFRIFGLEIQWYGIIIAIGLLLALFFCMRQFKKVGLDSASCLDVVTVGCIGGIVGARTYYVVFNWSEYAGDLKSILNVRQGGLAIYGGVIGALIIGAFACKICKVKILPMLDVCGVGFLLGQAIGRWGNFTNQEAFGCNTGCIFGMSGGMIQNWITRNYNSEILDPNYMVHPCFFYESVWCLIGFFVLAYVLNHYRKFDGQIALLYIGWYGLGRFFIEGLRTDSLTIGEAGTLRVSQILAFVCVIFSVIMLLVCFSKIKRMGNDYKLYCNTEESRMLLEQAENKN
ncbi:MAG: prolipoprotein diacylglyceryl transferase, partial [Oscillospiraceae bacterium]|nr:prolipoprotein diacylglyceryl transferase [Oscillospiraceae bacterium]